MKRIVITRGDIELGKVGSEKSCPIALACKRAGFHEPFVAYTYIKYGKGRRRKTVTLPEKASNFIDRFDNTGNGQPFSFVIR